jgi:predicted esterase
LLDSGKGIFKENDLIVQKHGRYCTLGNPDTCNVVVVALHGYGQLAKYFGRKFSPIPQNVLLILPEGLHRFYINGSSGRVGASWMTKESRITDIEDNQLFLDSVVNNFPFNQYKRCILIGFSQGGATAARYFFQGNQTFSDLVLWGCVFPPDITPNFIETKGANKLLFIGDRDPYFPAEYRKQMLAMYLENGFSIIPYVGAHDINACKLWETLRVD